MQDRGHTPEPDKATSWIGLPCCHGDGWMQTALCCHLLDTCRDSTLLPQASYPFAEFSSVFFGFLSSISYSGKELLSLSPQAGLSRHVCSGPGQGL